MHPVIVGPLKSYGLALAISFALGIWVATRRGRAVGLKAEETDELLRRGIGGEDPCAPLADEWHVLVWNKDRDGIADGQEDHATDAGLYALRRLRDYTRAEPAPPLKQGTAEWQREEERKMEAAAMRQPKNRMRSNSRRSRTAGKVA